MWISIFTFFKKHFNRSSKCIVLSLSTPFQFRFHNLMKWLFCSVLCFRYINRKWNVCHFPLIFNSDNIISNEDWSNMYWLTTRIIGYSLTAYSNTILSQFLRTFEVLVILCWDRLWSLKVMLFGVLVIINIIIFIITLGHWSQGKEGSWWAL